MEKKNRDDMLTQILVCANSLLEKGEISAALEQLLRIENPSMDIQILISELSAIVNPCMIDKKKIVQDYYQTGYEKRVLIIYTIAPFCGVTVHTNAQESLCIAKGFHLCGYRVDIIDYEYSGDPFLLEKYDVIFGLGRVFENICSMDKFLDSYKIAYLTEKPPHFNNLSAVKRMRYFKERNGFVIPLERQSFLFSDPNVLPLIDCAICLGQDELTKKLWKLYFDEVYYLNATGFSNLLLNQIQKKKSGIEFLWYGSRGGIHKGLDLCIEAFRELPEYNLHIVGAGLNDTLYDFYRKDLEFAENIFYYGWLDHESIEWKEVCEKCDFVICPSCSEGQCTSVLTCMFAGMIPIGTKELGIEVGKVGGFTLDEASIDRICETVRSVSQISKEELYERMKQSFEYVTSEHNLNVYEKQICSILKRILKGGK